MKLYDVRAIARFLDVSERRVRQLRDEKVIAEVRPGLYDLIDTNHRYINYLRKRNPEGDETIDYNTERAKLVRAKRKNEEYELQLKENQLHAAEDIEAVMTDMLVNFKSRLMAIPSKLAPVLCKKTDKAEIFALLKDHIDEALMELSDFKTTFGERVKEDEKSDGCPVHPHFLRSGPAPQHDRFAMGGQIPPLVLRIIGRAGAMANVKGPVSTRNHGRSMRHEGSESRYHVRGADR